MKVLLDRRRLSDRVRFLCEDDIVVLGMLDLLSHFTLLLFGRRDGVE